MTTLSLRQRVSEYEKLMRLDKPIGILLLLWPTLWALWVAGAGRPSLLVVAIFVIGTVLMRSAGCVINDYADRNFDGHVERTRNRPLAAVLFDDPRVRRAPLEAARLDARDSRWHHAARATGHDDLPALWARRSAFHRGGVPLLITEIFLPAILNLAP